LSAGERDTTHRYDYVRVPGAEYDVGKRMLLQGELRTVYYGVCNDHHIFCRLLGRVGA
jgi:hypothetical protein